MKYLFFSMLLGAGLTFFIMSGKGKNALADIPSLNKILPLVATADEEESTEVKVGADAEPMPHMVRIHGKWYKYRSDNTYVIDGVPTLHIVKRPKDKMAPSKNLATVESAPAPDANLEKSRRLAKMAGENPLKVYTPDGFQTLKEGLDAANISAKERKKALEEISAEE